MMKNARICVVLIVILTFTIIMGAAASAFAAPLSVCDVCPFGCTYSSIQSAINAATDGDEIEVCDGTYVENIDFLGKDISVISRNGPASTVIDGNLDGAVVTFAAGEGPGAVLSGFSLRNGSGHYTGMSHGGGIYIEGASPTITHCEITANSAAYGSGISLDSSSASITDCVFYGNANSLYDGAGIYCTSSSPTITDCTFDTNYAGRDGGGIYCDSSTITLTGSSFTGNSASRRGSGNGGGVALADSSAVISNCTFSDNRAGDQGGGLWCDSDSPEVTVTGSTFSGNEADIQGGGIYSHAASPTFNNCTLTGNTAGFYGGGIYLISPSGEVNNCTIRQNYAGQQGGGLALYGTSAEVDGCSIADNTAGIAGGGVWVYSSAAPAIRNSRITGNSAEADGGGILMADGSTLTLVNTIINNNSVIDVLPGYGTGGGIAIYSSTATLMNCTVRKNSTTRYGGGLYSESSTATVTNSIFWDNTPDEIDNAFSSEPAVTYSDVEGGYPGVGNIDSAPFFVSGSDCRLREISPCINQGTLIGAADDDIDGDVRPTDTFCDMGADEFTGITYPVPEILVNGLGGVVDVSKSETDNIIFTLALEAHDRIDDADWWIVQSAPYGLYFLTSAGWIVWPTVLPSYQGPIFTMAPLDFPAVPISSLPTGSYFFYFAVDTVKDGIITWEELFFDWVQINLTE